MARFGVHVPPKAAQHLRAVSRPEAAMARFGVHVPPEAA
ncbi:hypothetical protein HD595_004436 [Nonomuraea roseoviolacea subsp. carminata]|uniref:Uncharacterized protein n=1 Tax=Nonomuraea roseoviolacea subsp. carminata TaxID=160689 RepID=A0ABT1K2T7_9ACTN|nr:hypothetical protein [Nonomuraea roseoviolacea subsp. carminata]